MMYSKWLSLSLETRNKIAVAFDIQKKGATEVFSNTIKSDGYMVQDIEGALTVKAMQDYLGSTETDKDTLAQMLIDVMEGRGMEIKAEGTFSKMEVMETTGTEGLPEPTGTPKVVKKKAVKKVAKVVKKVAKKKK